jgi:hypothetical protein
MFILFSEWASYMQFYSGLMILIMFKINFKCPIFEMRSLFLKKTGVLKKNYNVEKVINKKAPHFCKALICNAPKPGLEPGTL